jgi:hypothetical protein
MHYGCKQITLGPTYTCPTALWKAQAAYNHKALNGEPYLTLKKTHTHTQTYQIVKGPTIWQ